MFSHASGPGASRPWCQAFRIARIAVAPQRSSLYATALPRAFVHEARPLARSVIRRWTHNSAPQPETPPAAVLAARALRVAIYGTLALMVAPGVVAYFIYREPVVVTGRDRPMLITPEQEAELGRQMLAQLNMAHALPPDDPRYRAVAAIAKRIVRATESLPAVQPAVTSSRGARPSLGASHKAAHLWTVGV
jgi:hypothetical protein